MALLLRTLPQVNAVSLSCDPVAELFSDRSHAVKEPGVCLLEAVLIAPGPTSHGYPPHRDSSSKHSPAVSTPGGSELLEIFHRLPAATALKLETAPGWPQVGRKLR